MPSSLGFSDDFFFLTLFLAGFFLNHFNSNVLSISIPLKIKELGKKRRIKVFGL